MKKLYLPSVVCLQTQEDGAGIISLLTARCGAFSWYVLFNVLWCIWWVNSDIVISSLGKKMLVALLFVAFFACKPSVIDILLYSLCAISRQIL